MSKTREKKRKLAKVFGIRCWYCWHPKSLENLTLDHIVAKSNKGGNRIINLALACEKCNSKKSHKEAIAFLESCNLASFQKDAVRKRINAAVASFQKDETTVWEEEVLAGLKNNELLSEEERRRRDFRKAYVNTYYNKKTNREEYIEWR